MILLNITDNCSNCEEACIHVTSGRSTDCCVCRETRSACDECSGRRDRQSERNYEQFCEDFYGGSSPFTIDEQHRAAWEEKRRLK